MNETVTLAVVAKDLISSPLAKMAKGASISVDQTKGKLDSLDNAMVKSGNSAHRLGQRISNIKSKSIKVLFPANRNLTTSISAINSRLDQLRTRRDISVDTKQIKRANREIENLERTKRRLESRGTVGQGGGGMLGGVTGMLGPLAAGAGLFSVGKGVFDKTMQYEKQRAVLTNTFSSQYVADRSMRDIQEFAERTPFQVTDLTDSFVKLANQGFKPTMKEMTKLGDLASSTGKGFDQLTEAIIDAQTGEFERLKEFGIKGETHGNKVKFTFKGVTQEVDKNATSIRNYILSLGDIQGVQGSMAAISETLGGQVSNLSDKWDKFLLTMGKSRGVFSDVTGYLGDLVDGLSRSIEIIDDKRIDWDKKLASLFNPSAAMVAKDQFGIETAEDQLKYYQDVDKKVDDLIDLRVKTMGKAASNDDKEKFNQAIGQFEQFGTSVFNNVNKIVDKAASEMFKSMNPESTAGNGGGSGGSGSMGSKINEITGDARVAKNIVINIEKQVETINYNTGAGESVGDLTEAIKRALLTAVNQVNYAVQ